MLAFLFKSKTSAPEADADLELAKLALSDRIDLMIARETKRKLRYATLAETRH
jgi:hypothetical protein